MPTRYSHLGTRLKSSPRPQGNDAEHKTRNFHISRCMAACKAYRENAQGGIESWPQFQATNTTCGCKVTNSLIRLSGNGNREDLTARCSYKARPSPTQSESPAPFQITSNYHIFSNMACYYPGGMWAAGFYPCDPTAVTSLCCPQGWTCMSDGRCLVTSPGTANATNPVGTSYRGTCTNPQWDAAKCGNFCLGELHCLVNPAAKYGKGYDCKAMKGLACQGRIPEPHSTLLIRCRRSSKR